MNENGQESSLSDFEAARSNLRQRWELASVLNFFKVFEPVIESNLKISAEEIETSLIQPNKSLAQIHIALLKGIPPVNKNLKDPDAWVVSLSKKLIMWWPWVAEGDFPLTADKGAEMATYKKLDPTIRLVVLKALCEIRADQHDVVSYINEGVKTKNEMSTFRKTNIGEDGKGTSYWCDGNEVIGFRLYKEFNTFKKNAISCQWETLATNLEEFQIVVDEYSSSKSKLEVAVSVAVENEVMPALNKLEKKRQKALQKKMHEERIVNNFIRVGTTRSCRSSKPINYTFAEYDKAINEAIRETKKTKPKEEERSKKKVTVVKEDLEQDDDEEDGKAINEGIQETKKKKTKEEESSKKKVTVEVKDDSEEDENNSTESENSKLETEDVSQDSSQDSGEESNENNGNHSSEDDDNEENNDDDDDSSEDESVKNLEIESGSFVGKKRKKDSGNDDDDEIEEMRDFGTKKRLRQRPNRNSALESAIVCDTEDESSSENSDS
ncbi:hypothetical protein LXL04_032526 [Taraxacum kok-saghyz]